MDIWNLFEDVRPSELYHGTSPRYAENILVQNSIEANTKHRVKPGVPIRPSDIADNPDFDPYRDFKSFYGVSLTRNKLYAIRWSMYQVVFVLDAVKLKQTHRLIPFSFYGTMEKTDRPECEEFVIGPVKNVSRFIKKIEIEKSEYDRIRKNDRYDHLLAHPLLSICEGGVWNRPAPNWD